MITTTTTLPPCCDERIDYSRPAYDWTAEDGTVYTNLRHTLHEDTCKRLNSFSDKLLSQPEWGGNTVLNKFKYSGSTTDIYNMFSTGKKDKDIE